MLRRGDGENKVSTGIRRVEGLWDRLCVGSSMGYGRNRHRVKMILPSSMDLCRGQCGGGDIIYT